MYRVTRRFLRSRFGYAVFSRARSISWGRRLLSTTAHPTRGVLMGSGDMRADWDRRAREDGRFYTAIDFAQSEEEFSASGERDTDALLLEGLDLSPDASVLEIGSGLGRLLAPMAARAAVVCGVDISAEMVRQASERLVAYSNVRVLVTDGSLDFPDNTFDFCWAYKVFHHVPKKEYVHRYFQEASRVLKPGGVFRFQVCIGDEKDRTDEAGTWFGILFSQDELRAALPHFGFDVVSMRILEEPERKGLAEALLVICQRQPKDGVPATTAVRLRERALPRVDSYP